MHNNAVLQKSLVVFQFVIAVFLISSSFIIYRQLQFVNSKDLGFNKNQVVTFHIDDMKVRNEIPALKSALLQNTAIEDVAVAGNAIGDSYLGGHDFTFAIFPCDGKATLY
jgi:putative ABC transport system permease protein